MTAYAGYPAHFNDGNLLMQVGSRKEASVTGRYATIGISAVLAVFFLCSMPGSAPAEINVSVNAGPAPAVSAEPPEVVLIPGAGVYFNPDAGANLFFHDGFWWSHRGNRWYRSRVYNGPWVAVEQRVVPVEAIRAPRDYPVRLKKAKHVPSGKWKKGHRKFGKRWHGHDH